MFHWYRNSSECDGLGCGSISAPPQPRAILLVVPEVFLLVLLLWLALDVAIHMMMDSSFYAFTVIGISVPLILILGYFVVKSRWEKERALQLLQRE
jgi:hypothetical protein